MMPSTRPNDFLTLLHPEDDKTCYELRAFDTPQWPKANKLCTFAGYFQSPDGRFSSALSEIQNLKPPGIYVSLNRVTNDWLAKANHRFAVASGAISDADIVRREWLFIDVDPVRVDDNDRPLNKAKYAATDREVERAKELASKVHEYLASEGWPEPLQCFSGNGSYLLYKIDLPNDEPSKLLLQRILQTLNQLCEGDQCQVDETGYNASRVVRLCGTVNGKGDHTDKRPHRQSWFVQPDGPIEAVPIEKLQELATKYDPTKVKTVENEKSNNKPNQEKPAKIESTRQVESVNVRSRQRLDLWIEKAKQNGLDISQPKEKGDGSRVYHFPSLPKPCEDNDCPHDADSAPYLLQRSNGAIAAGCLHARCKWGWKDLKQAYAGEKVNAAKLDCFEVAQELLSTQPIVYWSGDFWLWEEGCYRLLNGDSVKALVYDFLNDSFSNVTRSAVENVLGQLMAQSILPPLATSPCWLCDSGGLFDPQDCIATPNGIVHLRGLIDSEPLSFLPATPDYFCTTRLDFDIRQESSPRSKWIDFLFDIFESDHEAILCLQEWFGYVLSGSTKLQKMLLLVGPPRSGKGTIARVLCRLIGIANVASPTLRAFAENFGLQNLIGKSLAIIGDARIDSRTPQGPLVERLLSISGEDYIQLDRKYKEPIDVRLGTRIMILSNMLPRLHESSSALANRFVILKTEKSFLGAEDPDLEAKLVDELHGIFHWALQGLQRLLERGRFEPPSYAVDQVNQMIELGSPVTVFVRDYCKLGANETVSKDSLYLSYQAWCRQTGHAVAGREVFARDLQSAFPEIATARPRVGEERVRQYVGIGLQEAFAL